MPITYARKARTAAERSGETYQAASFDVRTPDGASWPEDGRYMVWKWPTPHAMQAGRGSGQAPTKHHARS